MKLAKETFMYALGAIIIAGFFLLLYKLIGTEIPEGNKDTLSLVIGALLAAFTSVVAYFYGSSKGSSDKNELLKK
jgi:drug/metabolite transporter (DMT)-like permease